MSNGKIKKEDILSAAEIIKKSGFFAAPPRHCKDCAFNGDCRIQRMWRRSVGEDQPGLCTLGAKREDS